jgi:hypothetical protein
MSKGEEKGVRLEERKLRETEGNRGEQGER